ncbi:MAG: toll/interleukin-1 receptor domain-containing protein [Burkholderiales bacterium]|nr:toll/interleukin-1 receptor domain-containing protein [Burkholderiales bacterium]
MPAVPVKLFLSYGRADASALADRLARDLAQHGVPGRGHYLPWVDRAALVGGRAWSDQLAVALDDADVVLALLSPHSVRSLADGQAGDDSVCLDEIAYARFQARKPIVPVLVAPCAAPFEIYRLQQVDFRRWDDEAAYAASFASLLDSIGAALDGKPLYRHWQDRLQPWDFGRLLAARRQGFVGRDWLFQALATRLAGPAASAVLVTGGPGFGKSAFIAEYLHRNPEGRVLAYHCCQADTRETLNAGRFVRSVAAMIASRHPRYEALLDQAPYRDLLTEKSSGADPGSAFEEAVLAALEQVGPPQAGRWTLVVDALDEASEAAATGANGIVQLLAERIGRFPDWLTLVATTRPERRVLDLFAGVQSVIIDPGDPANLADLRRHVAERLARAPLDDLVRRSRHTPQWIAATIGDAAQGNFLYAEQVLLAMQDQLLHPDELDAQALPPGLTRQYRLFFGRRYTSDAAWAAVRPLFAVFVAAQAPLGDAELVAATGLDARTALPRQLRDMGAYVTHTRGAKPRHALFHRSLLEWLTGPDELGGRFAIDPAEGHVLLADGLFNCFGQDRLSLSDYLLSHLATHLAAAARGDPASRAERQRALADFVLEPMVQQQRLGDPFGALASLRLALQTVAEGPPLESAAPAIRLALGLETFRRERLDASRVFDLAAAGHLAQAERELQLYDADEPWRHAAHLTMAWLALGHDRAGAEEARKGWCTHTVLDERVAADFEQRAAVYPPLPPQADVHAVNQILQQVGGGLGEGLNPSMLWDQAAPPVPGQGRGVEGTRYLAEFQAPVMVAFARDEPVPGNDKLREYVALNAANAYRVYRNGTLWEILLAVVRHPDPRWVCQWARLLIASALSARGWEFGDASPIVASALRARAHGERGPFDAALHTVRDQARLLANERGRGDSWGAWRRRLAAHAQARCRLWGEEVSALLDEALALPPGYAGFQAPVSLDLAATLAACGLPDRVPRVLDEAERAGHNVQDLVFCARTTSRVHALRRRWQQDGGTAALSIVQAAQRLAADPGAPEFAALHVVGEPYRYRQVVNPTSRLPGWLLQARNLIELRRAYQWATPDWRSANADIAADDTPLPDGHVVRVPDPRFAPHLAAWLAQFVLAATGLTPQERTATILPLLPLAVPDRTELDAVIAALLLAWAPLDAASLDDVEAGLARYALPAMATVAGPEPVA